MYKLALLTGSRNHVVASSGASAIFAETRSFLVAAGSGLGVGDFALDVLSGFEHGFPSEEVGDTVDEGVDEIDFGGTESVSVGDIELTTGSSRVDTGSTSSLELELRAEFLESGSLGELGDNAHGTGTETSSTV